MNTALEGVRGQRHAPAALYSREGPGTHCTEDWVGPRTGLDRCGKSRPPTGIRSPDRPASSQSLYRLRFPPHTSYTCRILMKNELSEQILEKFSNTKFHENPFSGSRVVPRGHTASRRDEGNSRFSQFCERALKNSIRLAFFSLHDVFDIAFSRTVCHGVMDVVSFMQVFYIVYQ